MLNRYLIISLILIPSWFSAMQKEVMAQQVSIPFLQSYSWEKVLTYAKEENKLVFVDVYTTWCFPCKKMEKQVYTDIQVAKFFGSKFLNYKVQADTGKNDSETVKQMYPLYERFQKKYKIKEFPSYLFINAEGQVVHSGKGFMEPSDFLRFAKMSLNSNTQSETLLKEYERGNKSLSFLRNLASVLKITGNIEKSSAIFDEYLSQQQDWSSAELIKDVFEFMSDYRSSGYRKFLENREKLIGMIGFSAVFEKQKNIAMAEIMPAMFDGGDNFDSINSKIKLIIQQCFDKMNERKFMIDYAELIYYQVNGKNVHFLSNIEKMKTANIQYLNDNDCYSFAKTIMDSFEENRKIPQLAKELIELAIEKKPLEKYKQFSVLIKSEMDKRENNN